MKVCLSLFGILILGAANASILSTLEGNILTPSPEVNIVPVGLAYEVSPVVSTYSYGTVPQIVNNPYGYVLDTSYGAGKVGDTVNIIERRAPPTIVKIIKEDLGSYKHRDNVKTIRVIHEYRPSYHRSQGAVRSHQNLSKVRNVGHTEVHVPQHPIDQGIVRPQVGLRSQAEVGRPHIEGPSQHITPQKRQRHHQAGHSGPY